MYSQGDESSHRERAAYLPRRRAVGARGSSVGGSAARRWRRRDLGRRGGVGPPADREAGERWRHVWCARQNRLPLFAVLRLDARAKRARGRSAVGCCVWAFGTVGRTRSSSLTGPHRSACTAHLGASGGPKLVCGASPPRRRIVGAAATRLPRTIHRCGGGRRASTETAAELVLWSRGGHRL